MSIENSKPLDPIVEEFLILTKMTSSDDVRLDSLKDTKVDVVKGAGSMLRPFCKKFRSGSINSLKFDMGSSDENFVNCSLNKDSDTNGLSPFNNGSFIKVPACPNNDSVLNLDSESPMAIGSDPKDSIEQ
nr:hypothetical protein [Tanacetum cinerariifolium]